MDDAVRSRATHLRALPDRPNLEHLKNEAKARLKFLRAADASAQLATAQREIAKQYGFPSWRQLRARVSTIGGAASLQTSEETIARLRAEQSKPRKEVRIDPASLDRFTGYYKLKPGRVFSVLQEGDGLIVRLTAQKFFAVLPESDQKFFYKNPSIQAQLTFISNGEDRAYAVILHQHGLEQPAKRIDEGEAKAVEDELEQRRRRNSPSPGSEDAVRRFIRETQAGNPNYDLMSEGLAQAVRDQLADNKRELNRWGPVVAVKFVGVAQSDGSDVYDIRFSDCRTEWRIGMETSEIVRSASYRWYP